MFYASWLDAIEAMPDNVRGEALMAILVYALRGETTEKQGAMTKVIMAMVKPQIEANNKRYENGCKGGEFGKLGGRPKKEITPNKPQENPKITPNKPQENPYNDNVNDNYNVNDNESECEKNAHAHTHEEIFEKFKIQCEKVAPLALDFKEPLTVEQFAKLYDKYGWQKVAQCATELHNKEANKKNRRAYTAWQAFIEKIK